MRGWGIVCSTSKCRLPTIHLHQQLVQGVLLLTLTPKVPPSSLPPHRVDLVNEEDAGGILPRHGKHVPHLHEEREQSNIQ